MITYFEEQIKIIDKALHSIDEKNLKLLLQEIIQTIKSGHKIVVSGLGKNVSICEKIVGTMVSLGLDAYFLHTNSAVHGDMGIVKEGDLVIILTKSGETVESIYLAEVLNNRNANLWLLSFNRESSLTRKINKCIIVEMEHEGDMWNIMPNNSTTLNLIILQGIAMMAAKELGIELKQFKENHPGGYIGAVLEGLTD